MKMEKNIKEINEMLKKISDEVKEVAAKQEQLMSLMTEVNQVKVKLVEKERKSLN